MNSKPRKIMISFHDSGVAVWDKKSGDDLQISKLPSAVRQWFKWDEYCLIEVDEVTGEARVVKEED